MIRAVVAIGLLAHCAGAPVWAQEGGAAGVAVQRPDHVQAPPEQKPPKPDIRAFTRMIVEDYPPSSLRRREQGAVKISLCVSAEGKVSDVRLVESSGFPALDDATLKGMAKMKFQPGLDTDGKPVDRCDPPYALTIVWKLPPS